MAVFISDAMAYFLPKQPFLVLSRNSFEVAKSLKGTETFNEHFSDGTF